MSEELVGKYAEQKVPAWVVQRAVANALGVESVRGIDNGRGDSSTYHVMVERGDDTGNATESDGDGDE